MMTEYLKSLFDSSIIMEENIIHLESADDHTGNNQEQTKDVFSDKWNEVNEMKDVESLYKFQYEWFLKLYGFSSEEDLAGYLSTKKYIIDTGCGLGYKAAWFAKLSPRSIVIGIDISDAVNIAAKNFKTVPNLFFLKRDIANTGLIPGSIDFTVCDQVIMHTEIPEKTFAHLCSITKPGGEFACYVYRKKALPRELLDDYFRKQTHEIPKDKMWEFSDQLTALGKALSDLKVNFICPEIPLLGIKGGEYDIQWFIYWNFLKCFWKEDWSYDLNKSTNYDWFAPSNARRFSKEEFMEMINSNNLSVTFFHEEEACYTGRFKK